MHYQVDFFCRHAAEWRPLTVDLFDSPEQAEAHLDMLVRGGGIEHSRLRVRAVETAADRRARGVAAYEAGVAGGGVTARERFLLGLVPTEALEAALDLRPSAFSLRAG